MSQILSGGKSISLDIPYGGKLAVSALAGSYSAIVTAGADKGTTLATNATTDQTFGAYATGNVVLLSSSTDGEIDYDVAAVPVLNKGESPIVIVSSEAPSDTDGRPNGTIYIQTA
jgi:hypothetical protein